MFDLIRNIIRIGCCIALCVSPAELKAETASPEMLKTGKKSIGGSATVPLMWDKSSNFQLGVALEPEFGYFIADQVELTTKAALRGVIYSGAKLPSSTSAVRWGLSIGSRYYFDVRQRFFPYLGLDIGFAIEDRLILWAEIPIGLLVALNDTVGIQIGMPLKISFSPSTVGGFHRFEWTPGYLGVRAFF